MYMRVYCAQGSALGKKIERREHERTARTKRANERSKEIRYKKGLALK